MNYCFCGCLFFVSSDVFLGISGHENLTIRLCSTRRYKGEITISLQKEGFSVKNRFLQHAASFDVLNCTHKISINMGSFDVEFTHALPFWVATHKGSPPSATLYPLLHASMHLCPQTHCLRIIAYYAYCPGSTPPNY